MRKNNIPLLKARFEYWRANGLDTPDVYLAMADDSAIPTLLTADDAEEQSDVSRKALEMRRVRGQEPPFMKLGRREVRYPRTEFFRWLASRYVAPREPRRPAADEYTQVRTTA